MKEYLPIDTPDFITLHFEPAGLGSRGGAVVADNLIMIGVSIIIGMFLLAIGIPFAELEGSGTVMLALLVFLIFLLRSGYFVLFETLMNGQTPGKRMMGIRVLRQNGMPIGLREAVLRNFLRLADMLPSGYLLGGFISIRSQQNQRLGDMVAGTIVVTTDFRKAISGEKENSWGARWVARLERGESRHALTLPVGQISIRELALMEQFVQRSNFLPQDRRDALAWKMASRFLEHFELDPQKVRQELRCGDICTEVIEKIVKLAQEPQKVTEGKIDAGEAKDQRWIAFSEQVEQLISKGRRSLASMGPEQFGLLLDHYRGIITDLARAQSMEADHRTLNRLNRMAVMGHNLFYGYIKPKAQKMTGSGWTAFARQVRAQYPAMLLAAAFMFIPAIISYLAIVFQPELAYELVPDQWIQFEPASVDNMHDIPSLERPLATSSIMTNNLQVSLAAFAFGLTFGLGTAILLVFNGIYLGTIAAWFANNGNSRAFWGWVMPHGGTELLAIVVAGAAGFTLARALIAPGRFRRAVALKRLGVQALTLELGCLIMLVIAGLIEGLISPSSIGYGTRILIISISLLIWFSYFGFAGLRSNRKQESGVPNE